VEGLERPRGVPGSGEQDRGPTPDDRIRPPGALDGPREMVPGLRGQPEAVELLGGVDEERGGGPRVEAPRGGALRLAQQALGEERVAAPSRHARERPPDASARGTVPGAVGELAGGGENALGRVPLAAPEQSVGVAEGHLHGYLGRPLGARLGLRRRSRRTDDHLGCRRCGILGRRRSERGEMSAACGAAPAVVGVVLERGIEGG